MSFDLNSVLERWTPPATFTVPLGPGDSMEFRSCGTYGEYRELERKSIQFAQDFPCYAGSKTAELPPFSEWLHLPNSREEAAAAFIIKELCVSPALDDRSAMALLKAPMLVDFLLKAIRIHHKDVAFMSLGGKVEDEKKDLPETQD